MTKSTGLGNGISPNTLALALLLVATQFTRAVEPKAESPKAAATAAAEKKSAPASAGLVNDWLREKSEAANPWDVGGNIRYRYENRHDAGAFPNNDFIHRGVENDNDFFALRTRVHLGYTPVSWLNLFAEGRDARVWGDARPGNPENDEFDLYQAYFVLGDPKKFPVTLKLGRQEMLYGDERFVGISDWSTPGRSFDAAKVRYENDDFWVDAFAGRVVVPYDDHLNEWNDYDTFSGIYASTRKLVPWQETQLFFLVRNVRPQAPNASATGVPGSPTSARDVYTIGGRVKSLPGKLKGWDYSTELAVQFGSITQSGERRALQSFAADVTGGYTWSQAWGTPRLGAGYTYASGDSDFTDGKYETFEPLLGTNHRLYGYADLMGLRNVHNPSLTVSVKPTKQVSVRLDYLLFWLADDHDLLYPESGPGRAGNGYGRNPQYESYVGSEVDLIVNYQPKPWLEFQAGYSHFFAGKYIKQSVESVPANGSAVDADWVYLQAKFSF